MATLQCSALKTSSSKDHLGLVVAHQTGFLLLDLSIIINIIMETSQKIIPKKHQEESEVLIVFFFFSCLLFPWKSFPSFLNHASCLVQRLTVCNSPSSQVLLQRKKRIPLLAMASLHVFLIAVQLPVVTLITISLVIWTDILPLLQVPLDAGNGLSVS